MSPETTHEIAKMRRTAGRILSLLEACRDGVSVSKKSVEDAIHDLYDFRVSLASLGTDIVSGGSPTCGDFARALIGFEVDLAVAENWVHDSGRGFDVPQAEDLFYKLRCDLFQFFRIYETYLRRGAPLDYIGQLTEEERNRILDARQKLCPWETQQPR